MQQLRLGDGRDRFDRRAFCKAVGAATAVGVVEASLGSALAHANLTKEQRDKMTADEIILSRCSDRKSTRLNSSH